MPVTAQAPVAGLYSSGLGSAGAVPPELAPVISTWPSCSSVATPSVCAACMLPVAVKVPEVAAVAGTAARPKAAAAAATVTARERCQWIITPLLCVLTDMAGPAVLPNERPGASVAAALTAGLPGWPARRGWPGDTGQ